MARNVAASMLIVSTVLATSVAAQDDDTALCASFDSAYQRNRVQNCQLKTVDR